MDPIVQTKTASEDDIFLCLKQFIAEVIGADFAEEMEITPESTFTGDLGMDSIEIVSFSEKVKNHFGEKIDFAGWLSDMDLDEIIRLDLQRIITYIKGCL